LTTAEIITIGTELLLGEIQDKNTAFLAQQLRKLGIDLFRVTTIGDNTLRIADTIRESLSRADIVITTGGLGPTIDDPTRNAVAIAVNAEVIFHPELWKKIRDRFNRRGIDPSENNRKQAYLPENAIAIDNPVGTAPAFYIFQNNKMILCLPGVPAETETIFQDSVIPLLNKYFSLDEMIKTRVLHTSGIGESLIDELVADLEVLQNPTVGLSAQPGRVDIRITAKSFSVLDADRMIAIVENEIRQRIPDAIYGVDEETQQFVIANSALEKAQSLQIFLYGCTPGSLPCCEQKFAEVIDCTRLDEPFSLTSLPPILINKCVFAANVKREEEITSVELFFVKEEQHEIKVCAYNGPPSQADDWLANTFMDFIWRKLRNL